MIMFKTLLVFIVLFIPMISTAQALSAGAVKYLNDNYSGWKLHTLSRSSGCSPEYRKAVVSGDFDGNRKLDYVARITHKRSGYLIALMSQGKSFSSEILQSGPSADANYMGLSIDRKGGKYYIGDPYDGDNRTARLPNDAPVIGPCESHAYPYIYKNGSFKN